MTRQLIVHAAAAIIGATYVVVSSRVAWMHDPISRLALLALPTLTPSLIVLSILSRQQVRWTVLSFMVGVIGGVIIDVVGDPKPRNLFPLEIIAWYFALAPAFATGAIVVYLFRRRNAPKQ